MLLLDWSHLKMVSSESVSRITSMISSQIHLCHSEFKIMSSEAYVETCNSRTQQVPAKLTAERETVFFSLRCPVFKNNLRMETLSFTRHKMQQAEGHKI